MKYLLSISLIILTNISFSQFELEYSLPASAPSGASKFIDFDNDGDLDLYALRTAFSTDYDNIYKNDSNSFSIVKTAIKVSFETSYSTIDWGDFDNDGDIDIVIGRDDKTELYINNSGTFKKKFNQTTLTGEASPTLIDIDNDGDLDLITIDIRYPYNQLRLYLNDMGVFSNSNFIIEGVFNPVFSVADYDSDGDMDLIIAKGLNKDLYRYENKNGTLELDTVPFKDITGADFFDWADIDNDNDLDMLVMAQNSSSGSVLKIYKNINGMFPDSGIVFSDLHYKHGRFGDFNSDGTIDILCGHYNYYRTKIFKNTDGEFSPDSLIKHFAGIESRSDAIGDFNSDNNLDVFVDGEPGEIHVNDTTLINDKPDTPFGLSVNISNNSATLTWNPIITDETKYLTYNIYLGTSSNGNEIISSHSINSSGTRLISENGNVSLNTNWTIHDLPIGTYYWSVQAIDGSLVPSSFAIENSFTIGTEIAPNLISPVSNAINQEKDVLLTWSKGNSITKYWLEVSTDTLFNSKFVVDSNLTDTIFQITNLPLNQIFYWRIKGKSTGWSSYSETFHFRTLYPFVESGFISGSYSGKVRVGDINNDNSLDFALMNYNSSSSTNNAFYFRDNGTFSKTGTYSIIKESLSNVEFEFADFDADGDLDFFVSGYEDNISTPYCNFYQNDGNGTYTPFASWFVANRRIAAYKIRWVDYDNDGDLDFVVNGKMSDGTVKLISLKNTGSSFDIDNNGIPESTGFYFSFGDLDNDGDQDLIIPQSNSIILYSNTNGVYTNSGKLYYKANLPMTSLEIQDVNSDGLNDIIGTVRNTSTGKYSQMQILFNNGNGSYSELATGLPSVLVSSSSRYMLFDFNNDNQLDILVSGEFERSVSLGDKYYSTKLFINSNYHFSDSTCGLENHYGFFDLGDLDNDGDKDLIFSGVRYNEYGVKDSSFSKIFYRTSGDNILQSNTVPYPIQGMYVTESNDEITFNWNDLEFRSSSIVVNNSFDLRVGSYSGGNDIISCNLHSQTGKKGLTGIGNVGYNKKWTMKKKDSVLDYYWKVFPVDNNFEGPSEQFSENKFSLSNSSSLLEANNDSLEILINDSTIFDVKSNDISENNNTFSVVSIIKLPNNCNLKLLPDNKVKIVPYNSFLGFDTARYVIVNEFGIADTATVYITVSLTTSVYLQKENRINFTLKSKENELIYSLIGLENNSKIVELYNTNGKIIYSKKTFLNSGTINTKQFSSGVYFLSIFSQGFHEAKKVIIK